MKSVMIDEKRLKQLERAYGKLQALEAGGVDNWEWYSESLRDWNKENELEELIENMVNDFDDIMVDGVDYEFPAGRDAGISLRINNLGESLFKEMLNRFIKSYKDIEGR